jgi:hypothetical protein
MQEKGWARHEFLRGAASALPWTCSVDKGAHFFPGMGKEGWDAKVCIAWSFNLGFHVLKPACSPIISLEHKSKGPGLAEYVGGAWAEWAQGQSKASLGQAEEVEGAETVLLSLFGGSV